jgi:hypothetical protein
MNATPVPLESALLRLELELGILLDPDRLARIDVANVAAEIDILLAGRPQLGATLQLLRALLMDAKVKEDPT